MQGQHQAGGDEGGDAELVGVQVVRGLVSPVLQQMGTHGWAAESVLQGGRSMRAMCASAAALPGPASTAPAASRVLTSLRA